MGTGEEGTMEHSRILCTMHYFLCTLQATMHAGRKLKVCVHNTHMCSPALNDIISSFEDSDS